VTRFTLYLSDISFPWFRLEEEFEDKKGVIKIRKSKKDRQYNGQKTEGQTIQWSEDRRTDNTMVRRQKDRQYNGQMTEGQTIQWSDDRRTDNTMVR
jgi:hypothetical protein